LRALYFCCVHNDSWARNVFDCRLIDYKPLLVNTITIIIMIMIIIYNPNRNSNHIEFDNHNGNASDY